MLNGLLLTGWSNCTHLVPGQLHTQTKVYGLEIRYEYSDHTKFLSAFEHYRGFMWHERGPAYRPLVIICNK